MTKEHGVRRIEHEGFDAIELTSAGDLAATYVPEAGMVCASLRHRGEELLGQRRGLRVYAERGSTMGIPLLHPWANRLARRGYSLGETRIDFPSASPRLHADENGLPIHGLLAGYPGWEMTQLHADAGGAQLDARLDFAADAELMAFFPFAHELALHVSLVDSTLEVTTRLRATRREPVPIAFGYHPYFRLPDVPRSHWEVEVPVRRRMGLDERFLPTGQVEACSVAGGALGSRVLDDLYTGLPPEPVFALFGGGRRIEVAFGEAYRVAVIYAPASDDVVCFEPMTAPTNPFDGGTPLSWAIPGRDFVASFRVHVTETP